MIDSASQRRGRFRRETSRQTDVVSWETLQTELQRWHESRDRAAGRAALAFLEVELRLMVPALVRRTWPEDLVEDALRAFLLKLIKKPLPPDIQKRRNYVAQAFRYHCIDCFEARRRQENSVGSETAPWEPLTESSPSPESIVLQAERDQELRGALGKLDIADRIVLKLDDAPELLDDEELGWMGARLGLDNAAVLKEVMSAEGIYAITHVFDPGDDVPGDSGARRKRMERFRRRRARAREKMRALLVAVP